MAAGSIFAGIFGESYHIKDYRLLWNCRSTIFRLLKNVLLHTWERCFAFIKKVATVLFLVCVVMWYLSTYGIGAEGYGMVEPEDSFIASMGGAIAWILHRLVSANGRLLRLLSPALLPRKPLSAPSAY